LASFLELVVVEQLNHLVVVAFLDLVVAYLDRLVVAYLDRLVVACLDHLVVVDHHEDHDDVDRVDRVDRVDHVGRVGREDHKPIPMGTYHIFSISSSSSYPLVVDNLDHRVGHDDVHVGHDDHDDRDDHVDLVVVDRVDLVGLVGLVGIVDHRNQMRQSLALEQHHTLPLNKVIHQHLLQFLHLLPCPFCLT
jgi:hypothetical protein